MPQKRRRLKQADPLEQRLSEEAERLRQEAKSLRPGAAREALIRKARQAEVGAHMSEWLRSPGCNRQNRNEASAAIVHPISLTREQALVAERGLRSRLDRSAVMPLYFFDVRVLDDTASDEEGTELSSMDEVQDEAAYALADLLRDKMGASNGNPLARHLAIAVRDGSGHLLDATFLFEIKRPVQ